MFDHNRRNAARIVRKRTTRGSKSITYVGQRLQITLLSPHSRKLLGARPEKRLGFFDMPVLNQGACAESRGNAGMRQCRVRIRRQRNNHAQVTLRSNIIRVLRTPRGVVISATTAPNALKPVRREQDLVDDLIGQFLG